MAWHDLNEGYLGHQILHGVACIPKLVQQNTSRPKAPKSKDPEGQNPKPASFKAAQPQRPDCRGSRGGRSWRSPLDHMAGFRVLGWDFVV